MTLCFKVVVNMEDKHPLNLDKSHLCVNCSYVVHSIKLRASWHGLNDYILTYHCFIFLLFSYLF